jgi:hypothetical protein
MHTIMVIAGGFVLLAICSFIGYQMGVSPSGLAAGAKYFIPIWLVAAATNMWFGVARAGYSVADEAPIFLLIFAVPAAFALFIWWKFATHGA